MVAVHVVGSYQVFAMLVFDMIETVLVKKLDFTPGHRIRLIARSAYVLATMFIAMTFPFFDGLLGFFGRFGFALATMFIAMTFPFFDGLLGFFGRFGFAPTTYFIPSIAWLILRKPNKFGLTWFINVFAECC
jgi:hypothetical protein